MRGQDARARALQPRGRRLRRVYRRGGPVGGQRGYQPAVLAPAYFRHYGRDSAFYRKSGLHENNR